MYFSMISVRLRTSSVVFPNAPNNILLSLLIKEIIKIKSELNKSLNNDWWLKINEWRNKKSLHFNQTSKIIKPQHAIKSLYEKTKSMNPFVTTEITLNTANKLRSDVIKNYYRDIRKLRRRLTFKNVENIVVDIENKLYKSIFNDQKTPKISLEDLKK